MSASRPRTERGEPPGLGAEKLKEIYLQMRQIRLFEEKVAYFFSRGLIHGTTHLYVGEEATATGAMAAIRDVDYITSTHRGHGHCIAKGIDLKRMMSELLGKENGYCKGKGGSMHIADLERGNLGANGVVGGGLPIAVGAGITIKLKKLDRVVLCFFGDGAMNEGTFHESVNLASIWRLPVVFICENNNYGMSMSVARSTNVPDLSIRAAAYGIPGQRVDGNDVLAVYEAVSRGVNHARRVGPALVVCQTYRLLGHSKSDANRYRTKEEIAEWKARDPIPRLRRHLEEMGLAEPEELEAIEKQAAQDIEEAVAFAQESSEPALDSILADVYA